jgi:hypothetical protein
VDIPVTRLARLGPDRAMFPAAPERALRRRPIGSVSRAPESRDLQPTSPPATRVSRGSRSLTSRRCRSARRGPSDLSFVRSVRLVAAGAGTPLGATAGMDVARCAAPCVTAFTPREQSRGSSGTGWRFGLVKATAQGPGSSTPPLRPLRERRIRVDRSAIQPLGRRGNPTEAPIACPRSMRPWLHAGQRMRLRLPVSAEDAHLERACWGMSGPPS